MAIAIFKIVAIADLTHFSLGKNNVLGVFIDFFLKQW